MWAIYINKLSVEIISQPKTYFGRNIISAENMVVGQKIVTHVSSGTTFEGTIIFNVQPKKYSNQKR
jgi:hypothetical protein